MKRYSGITLLLACGMLSTPVQAAENMKFYGTLVEPPLALLITAGMLTSISATGSGLKRSMG